MSGQHGHYARRSRRPVAVYGPLAAAAVLVVLVGTGVYALSRATNACVGESTLTLSVAAAPGIAPAVTKAATAFDEEHHKVGEQCVRAQVRPTDPAAVATLLSGAGSAAGARQRPDVWIPDTWLWTAMAGARGGPRLRVGASLAQSPLVVALPATLAARLREQGVISDPSWDNLLSAAGGTAGGAVTKNPLIPPDMVRLRMPDPLRDGSGMSALVLARILLESDPNRDAIFTGMVRTMRQATVPSVPAEFAGFRKKAKGRFPVALAPEQAVWSHNRAGPEEPAVALYPVEGTLMLDFPYVVTSPDPDKAQAAELLENALTGKGTRKAVQELGLRAPDGGAPVTFNADTGVRPQRPKALPKPRPAAVRQILQAWAKLSLSIRMLSLIDISGSMSEEVAPGTSRLQATLRTALNGLSLLPDDSELGQWVFSTKLVGEQDWREVVSLGPLGQRLGSATRRQIILSSFPEIQVKQNGDTGLYETIVAAFKYMKRTYKPEFVNSILLWTDGRNDDPGGPSLEATLRELRAEYDPAKPIQVIMVGFGGGVDTAELEQIAGATHGDVFVVRTPSEIQRVFLQAISRRVCAPRC